LGVFGLMAAKAEDGAGLKQKAQLRASTWTCAASTELQLLAAKGIGDEFFCFKEEKKLLSVFPLAPQPRQQHEPLHITCNRA
jgi:hypothetical protein